MEENLDEKEYVAALRKAVRATREFATKSPLSEIRWAPAPRSRAQRDIDEIDSASTGAAWGHESFDRVFGLTNLMMTGAVDALGGLEKQLSLPIASIGPVLLARAVIELAATVWWITDPNIDARQRAGRELSISLIDATRLAKIGKKFTRENDLHKQEAYVRGKISQFGLALEKRQVEGQAKPDATDLTGRLLSRYVRDGTHSEFVYQHYSAVGHGDPYGLISMVAERSLSSGELVWQWGIDRLRLASAVEFSILSFHDAYTRLSEHLGWANRIAYDAWRIKVRSILPP